METVDELKDRANPVKQSINTHDRITVRCNLYHEQRGEDAKQVEASFSRFLDTKEQPYERILTVGEQPTALDLGWLSEGKSGMVWLENRTSVNKQVKATPEEIEALKLCVIQFGYTAEQGFTIPPGEMAVVNPTDAAALLVRCLNSQQAKLRIFVAPK